MDTENAPAGHGADAEDIDTRGAEAERTRIAGIYEACRKLRLEQEAAELLVRDGVTLDEARGALINLAADCDEKIVTRSGISMAGLAGGGAGSGHETELLDRLRGRGGRPLCDIARDIAASAGFSVRSLRRDELFQPVSARSWASRGGLGGLHTTSDFPSLLGSATGRYLVEQYQAAASPLKQIGTQSNRPDLRAGTAVRLGDAPALLAVNEGGEITHGSAPERARVGD